LWFGGSEAGERTRLNEFPTPVVHPGKRVLGADIAKVQLSRSLETEAGELSQESCA
jgi:hypothetical protein